MAQNRAEAIHEYTLQSQSCKNVDTIHREKYVKNRSFSDFYHFFFVEDDEGRVCLRARERHIYDKYVNKSNRKDHIDYATVATFE